MALAGVLKFVRSPAEWLYSFDPLPQLKTHSEDNRVNEVAQKAFIKNYNCQRAKYVFMLFYPVALSTSGLLGGILESRYPSSFRVPFARLLLVNLAIAVAVAISTFFISYTSPMALENKALRIILQTKQGSTMPQSDQLKVIALIQQGASVDEWALDSAKRKNCQHIVDYLVSIGVPEIELN
jgi:hypothetical protein